MVEGRIQLDATKVGIRQLRSAASTWVRRAQRGERIVVTINGVEVAQITEMTPLGPGARGSLTFDDLTKAGLVEPPAIGQDMLTGRHVASTGESGSTQTGVERVWALAADVQVDRLLAQVRGQKVRSR